MSQRAKFSVLIGATLCIILLTSHYSAASAQKNEITVLSSRTYIDDYGFYHLVGEIQNNLGVPITYAKIVATFYDSQGQVVATDFTYSMIDILRPGEKSPFEIALLDASQIQKISSYKLSGSWLPARALPAKLVLKVGDSYLDEYGFFHLVGEVQNIGENTANYVKVTAAFYDKDNKILASSFTYTSNDIQPGQSAPFEITLLDSFVRSIKTTSVNVQSGQYAGVMETIKNNPDKESNPPVKQLEVGKEYNVSLSLSASLTEKTKSLSVSLKNPKSTDAEVYEVHFSLPNNAQVKSASAPSGWTKEINGDSVTFSTESKPLLANKSGKFTIKLDKVVKSLDWDAFDKDGNIINSKTAKVTVRK